MTQQQLLFGGTAIRVTGEPEPTPAELRDAKLVRDHSWGGCRHEPRCDNVHACLVAIVHDQRSTRRQSA